MGGQSNRSYALFKGEYCDHIEKPSGAAYLIKALNKRMRHSFEGKFL